ncbi:hypothetical protein MPTK1_2g10970 [Marchantia polymorpha subsp. ruderalis]|uniref:Uncharacterized protein n=1 Tax=Marchantia polymorpha TaxID=3197 RepID=A0A2R6XC99_MARPO|nr:hypothetical protein MARPO_0023s0063 [Marchantia polymorpha]BBN01872.1 hypothetical protein Mp_2g10970 [Marchantia polymorpha subsp. ruderalis]|eukprot:PTQ43734.1 hypothetical protein MARPO_0023s0063 [Marchantia polymorpha]
MSWRWPFVLTVCQGLTIWSALIRLRRARPVLYSFLIALDLSLWPWWNFGGACRDGLPASGKPQAGKLAMASCLPTSHAFVSANFQWTRRCLECPALLPALHRHMTFPSLTKDIYARLFLQTAPSSIPCHHSELRQAGRQAGHDLKLSSNCALGLSNRILAAHDFSTLPSNGLSYSPPFLCFSTYQHTISWDARLPATSEIALLLSPYHRVPV